jgi:hypothetical protein
VLFPSFITSAAVAAQLHEYESAMKDLEQHQGRAASALRARDSLLRDREEHGARQQARVEELEAMVEKTERLLVQVTVTDEGVIVISGDCF